MRASVMIDILRNAIEAVVEARDATHVGYVALPLEDDLECNMLPVVDVLNDARMGSVGRGLQLDSLWSWVDGDMQSQTEEYGF